MPESYFAVEFVAKKDNAANLVACDFIGLVNNFVDSFDTDEEGGYTPKDKGKGKGKKYPKAKKKEA